MTVDSKSNTHEQRVRVESIAPDKFSLVIYFYFLRKALIIQPRYVLSSRRVEYYIVCRQLNLKSFLFQLALSIYEGKSPYYGTVYSQITYVAARGNNI